MHSCSNITYDPLFNNSSVMTDPNLRLGCHIEILERSKLLLDYQLSRCQSVLFFRFDLRFPEGYDYPFDNSLISAFLAYYIQRLKDKYGYLYTPYLWVREQSREKH